MVTKRVRHLHYLAIGAFCLVLVSCSGTKETRRSNRAAKKLEKLAIRYPELLRPDTAYIPITLRTPVIQGRLIGILAPVALPSNKEFPKTIELRGPESTPNQPEKMQGVFEDDTLKANVTFFNDGRMIIDYEIKPIAVDTIIQDIDEKIQPVIYKPMPLPWWKVALMYLGGAFIVVVLFRLATTSRG